MKIVALLEEHSSIAIEHMLVKLKVDDDDKAEISDLINDYGGKVLDFDSDFITAELTGNGEKIEKFIDAARGVGILELCRSGLISITLGIENALDISKL